MLLRTTRCRLDRMFKAALAVEATGLVIELNEMVGGESRTSRVDGDIAYIAGVRLRQIMVDRCYTDRNTMRRGLSSSEHGALQDLARATNEEARHPAMNGVGMEGHHARCFIVWSTGRGAWTPQPIPGVQMRVLAPTWHLDDNYPSRKMTLWSIEGGETPSNYRLADEALHLGLL